MKFLKTLLQGMVIGLANVIPGVSGGTMMVAMGIYERTIRSITRLFTRTKRSLRFLIPLLAGAALAILILSHVFTWALDHWNIPTSFFFVGLILGSFPLVFRTMMPRRISNVSMALFAVFFLVVIGGAFFTEGTSTGASLLDGSFVGLLLSFLVGIIAAATMVVPGVSGSMVLMILGYYRPVLYTITSVTDALKSFQIGTFFSSTFLLVPFGLGIVIGIFLVAKGIEYLLRHFRNETGAAILGLLCASPISILLQADWSGFSFLQALASIVLLLVGAICSLALSRLK